MELAKESDSKHFNDQVRHIKKIIPNANQLFQELQKLPWQEIIWGRTGRKLPRLCLGAVEQHPIGAKIRTWVQNFFLETMGVRCTVQGIFGNHYRTGKDWLPDHKDDYEDGEGEALHVVSLSFGATRTFRFVGMQPSFNLEEGDIIIFSPAQNAQAKHGIPKQTGVANARINLTCFCTFDGNNPYTSDIIPALVPKI